MDVLLLKRTEDAVSVTYDYGEPMATLGQIALFKESGDVRRMTPAPGDPFDRLFMGASFHLRELWRRGQGFPERTNYAAG